MPIGRWLSKAAEYFQGMENGSEEEIGRKLERLEQLRLDRDEDASLEGFLLDRIKRVREQAAALLAEKGRLPQNPAERSVFFVATRDWQGLEGLEAEELIKAWQAKDSLSPGGFWTLYLLALLQASGSRSIDRLADCAERSEWPMNSRIVALWSLGLLGLEEALPRLRGVYAAERNQRMRLAVVQACRFLGRPALDFFLDLLASEQTDEEVRAAAARGAAALGPAASDGLLGLLSSRDGIVREYAVRALISSGDPRAVSSLYPFKESGRDGRLRSLISRLLIDLGGDGGQWVDLADEEGAAALLQPEHCSRLLQLSNDEQVLIACTLAMGNRADPSTARALLNLAMAGSSDVITSEAWMALSRMAEDETARGYMLFGLEHGEAFSRFWAGLALLMAGQPILERL